MSGLFPFVVIGLFAGSVYALAAMGLVLTYKTSGIFNFAYGAIAMFCGFTFWQLRDGWHITSWVALPLLMLVIAPALGLVLEWLFRPLVGVGAEVQIVVSLGALAFLQAVVPLLYGGRDRNLTSIFPTSTFHVGARLNVGYDQLATLLLAACLGLGLWVLLRRTRLGTATRAVVDNRDLAELAGISSDSVSRVAWVISTGFAALVGILLSSSQGLDVYVLVIYAFAPAVLGKLASLPLAYLGAMVLGVTQSVLARWGSHGTVAQIETSIPYIALFVLLIAYGSRLKEGMGSLRPVTPRADRASTDRGKRRPSPVWLALVVFGVFLPQMIRPSLLGDVSAGLIVGTIALGLVVLTGWAGQISLAQFSFVGVGAFTAGHLAGAHGATFFPAALLGALIAIPLGLLVGLPSLRLSGLYLALATMAFALLMDNLVFVRRWISGGYTGVTVPRPRLGGLSFAPTRNFYYLVLGVFAVAALAAVMVHRGPVGRRLQMLRDAPLAASTLGVNLTSTKLAVFAACAATTAFAGALYGANRQAISPNDFAFGASLQLLLLVVVGGRSLVGGSVVAGAIFAVQLFPVAASVDRYVPLSVAILVVLVANNPEGILSVVSGLPRRYIELFKSLPAPLVERAARLAETTASAG
jgi:branched-chain amino acid transport system permease protein